MGDFGNLPSNCPPLDAQTPNQLTVYRFVEADPPQPLDFISLSENDPSKTWSSEILECQACGLSIYTNKQDAAKAKRKIPRFKKSMIAEGTLNGHSGVIKPTPSRSGKSHHS